MDEPSAVYERVQEEISTVLIGNETVVEGLCIAILTEGHVLLEGVPGVAKTTAAHLFARTSGLEYSRIQMTPDILPADITGTNVYRETTGQFDIEKGPIFANVVVADEINRATPKTQSALLEAMQEGQVTIEGTTLELPDPFLVIATQNPIELEGTFELPEAQRDRFQQKLVIDLPDRDEESELLDRFDADPGMGPTNVEQIIDSGSFIGARERIADVYVDPSVKRYILDIVDRTRNHPDVAHGASPRAAIAFLQVAKARAGVRGRVYVIPDDVKSQATRILSHRLVLSTDAELSEVSPEEVVEDLMGDVDVPGSFEPGRPEDVEASDDATAVSDGGDPQDLKPD